MAKMVLEGRDAGLLSEGVPYGPQVTRRDLLRCAAIRWAQAAAGYLLPRESKPGCEETQGLRDIQDGFLS